MELRRLAGDFYPAGMPSSRWLAHYASVFDTVEVNATFYRLPTVETVRAWADEVPDDFLFAVKGSRYLTHMKRLRDMGQGLQRFWTGAATPIWSWTPGGAGSPPGARAVRSSPTSTTTGEASPHATR